MPPLDNHKHERFARMVFEGVPIQEAYVKAGYEAHNGNPYRLREDERVQARIQELHDIAARAAAVDKSYVINGLLGIAERCINSEKFDPFNANKALELLGKAMGAFIDRKSLENQGGPLKLKMVLDEETDGE